MFNLADRSALVTGGQRGLGAAIAQELLERGAARVYVTAREPRASDDPRIVPVPLEVTDGASVEALAQVAEDVSILVNNAGRAAPSISLLASTPEDVLSTFETNVFGPIRMVQAFVPMLERHEQSVVVNMHSVVSWLAGIGAYGASKAALWSVSNSLRLELAERGIAVMGVHLGFADTDMTARLTHVQKMSPEFVATAVVDGIVRGDAEVLVDEVSASAKARLSGPVEGLSVNR
tara:strand:+ start:21 stop:722 length:702 start_codon:yes stop_codon:yes gene_type:complete